RTLSAAVEKGGDDATRLRACTALGAYLKCLDAPPRPTVEVVYDDDGKLVLRGQAGNSPPPRPELAFPLVNPSLQADAVGEVALPQPLSSKSGQLILVRAAEALHRQGHFAFIEAYVERVLGVNPRFVSAYWWRARARDASGASLDAIAD